MRSCHSRLAAPVIASVIAVAAIVGLGPVSAQASAPTPQWATQFGIAGANLTSFGVAVSPNGSSVVGMARYAGTPTIGGTTVTGASAMVKLSATGSIDWVAQTPDAAANAEAITAAPSGTTIIAGYLNGSTTIGGTALASAGGLDIFVAKLAADGSWLWAKSAGGTEPTMCELSLMAPYWSPANSKALRRSEPLPRSSAAAKMTSSSPR